MSEILELTMEDATDRESEAEPAFVDFYAIVARKKLGVGPEWEWYELRAVQDCTLVTGGVPNPGPKRTRWRKVTPQQVVVTPAELAAVRQEYEATTGNCHHCAGSGRTITAAGVRNGKAYREYQTCRRCGGARTAPHPHQEQSE